MPRRRHAHPIFLDSMVRKGKFVQVYRNRDTGRLAKAKEYQAQFKRKKRKPKLRLMWRCTFIVYLLESGGESPPAKFRITAWSLDRDRAIDLANAKLEKEAPEYVGHKDWRFEASACPQGEKVNEAVEQIEYDGKLLDTAVWVEETSKLNKEQKENVRLEKAGKVWWK